MPTKSKLIVWRTLLWPGIDFCSVRCLSDGWVVEGTSVGAFRRKPLRIAYYVRCNAAWQTQRARIEAQLGSDRRLLDLRADARQRWWCSGRELSALRGCADIDLQFSPITNLLPIRRLRLRIGQSAQVEAAWVRFPGLRLQRLVQRYARIDRATYQYASATGFSTELKTDSFGAVTVYPGIWERIASLTLKV